MRGINGCAVGQAPSIIEGASLLRKTGRYMFADYPHVFPPPSAEQVYVEGSAAAGDNTVETLCLLYQVPEGYWFRLTGLIATYAGVTFADGSGQTAWTLDVDTPTNVGAFITNPVLPSGYVVAGWNNFLCHKGSFDQGPFPVPGPMLFHGLETVRLKITTAAPFPESGSGVIFNSAFEGYLWPAERN